MIDLHSVVAFFHKAKWTELVIRYKINRVLGEEIISYSTVGKHVRMFVFSAEGIDIQIVPELEGDFSLDDGTALVLSEGLFLSVRPIAKQVMMSKSTGDRHLTHTMRWKLRHLKWVSHSLIESEKMN